MNTTNPGFCEGAGVGRSRPSVNSRAKGSRVELAAAKALSAMTHAPWERTQQRWGVATADVWMPRIPMFPVHVEVKGRAAGLKKFSKSLTVKQLLLTLDDLYVCSLEQFPRMLECTGITPHVVAVHNTASGWMRQASLDAREGARPIVLMRQDRFPWMVAWRCKDDDFLREAFRGVWVEA